MAAPRIFFSYASEDSVWVDAFQKSKGFDIGEARVLDYKAEEVGYGALKEALDEQIEGSAVVVAFVSVDYYKKIWTVAEWEKSLTEAQRGRLVFVPIMLDADAVDWWRRLRGEGKLSSLSRDYSYWSFLDAGGRRLDITPGETVVNGKIFRLTRQIRADLENKPCTKANGANEKSTGLTKGDGGGAEDHSETAFTAIATTGTSTAPPLTQGAGAEIVVLGHPAAALPPEMAEHIGKLCESLRKRNVQTNAWRDGWRRKADARSRRGRGP